MNNVEDNHVWVSIGITKNLGNYESMRLDAGAKIAGDPQDDNLWNKLWETVDAQLEAKLAEIDKGNAG
jgi:hypothetical protein|tara:strand:- start:1132 stop:1335 length:204 start_codon:yes stop_codon:yes gene_type:complete